MTSEETARTAGAPRRRARRAGGTGAASAAPIPAERARGPVSRSLAPPHIGETLGAVLLGSGILGVAMLIVATAVIVGGLTQASRFATPPPNVDELGRTQLIAGAALLLVAILELVLVAAIFADRPRARPLAALLDALLALLAFYGALTTFRAVPDPDLVVVLALAAVGAFFAVATVVLSVQLRRRSVPES